MTKLRLELGNVDVSQICKLCGKSATEATFLTMRRLHLRQEGVGGGVDALDQRKHGQVEGRSTQGRHPESLSDLIGQEETAPSSSALSMEPRHFSPSAQ